MQRLFVQMIKTELLLKKKTNSSLSNLSSQSTNQSDTPSKKVVMENEKNNTKIFQAGKFSIVINLSVKEVGPACSMLVYLNFYRDFLLKNNRGIIVMYIRTVSLFDLIVIIYFVRLYKSNTT